MITECGGISYRPDPTTPWFGYGTVTDGESYLAKYRELIEAMGSRDGRDIVRALDSLYAADRLRRLDNRYVLKDGGK